VSTPTARRPRLRQLRESAGWTQQELADKLVYLAWTHGDKNAGVNADMVAKWERGVKGISARYRLLLCELFGVTAAELGVAPPAPATRPPAAAPARDPESLVAMLDQAATLLNQLGAPGNALAPQLLSAWKDTATTRRTMLGLLDPAATDPAGHARAATATLTDLQQLADSLEDHGHAHRRGRGARPGPGRLGSAARIASGRFPPLGARWRRRGHPRWVAAAVAVSGPSVGGFVSRHRRQAQVLGGP
jgi:transcriptional regulator with XRE-family HTH domain